MKYIALVTGGLCAAILMAALLFHNQPMRGCASVKSSPMGTVMEGPNAKSRLSWDDTCPSGVAWTAK